MKRDDARPPESIGIVDVFLGPADDALVLIDPGAHTHVSSMLVVGSQHASIFLSFAVHDETGSEMVTLSLDTKQAYHLGAALMRARARCLRWVPPSPAPRSEGTPA